jgi:hypothetical protein
LLSAMMYARRWVWERSFSTTTGMSPRASLPPPRAGRLGTHVNLMNLRDRNGRHFSGDAPRCSLAECDHLRRMKALRLALRFEG